MASKPRPQTSSLVQEVLAGLEDKRGLDTTDWTAQLPFDWPPLLGAIAAADAGLMIRAADQRRALGVGLFVGASKVWATCRTQEELLGTLGDCQEALETILGAAQATRPTAKAKRLRKTPS